MRVQLSKKISFLVNLEVIMDVIDTGGYEGKMETVILTANGALPMRSHGQAF
jgi:hypothetical protein